MMNRIGLFLLWVVVAIGQAHASDFVTEAPYALVIEHHPTHPITLLSKQADVPIPPSSMSKLMTIYMVFEQLKAGKISLDQRFPVSEKAWRMQGTKMFVPLGSDVAVEDLLRGVIVQSGNDACLVLAEGLMGSEDNFVDAMNDRAKKLGLTSSNFRNATGWPEPDHRMSLEDLARLAVRLIEDFPEYYHYFSETEFTYHGIRQGNRNSLLTTGIGVDGLKTGHTDIAGYGVVVSAVREQGKRRLIVVVNGLPSEKKRAFEVRRLIEHGFSVMRRHSLYEAQEKIVALPVWMGRDTTVMAVPESPIEVMVPRGLPMEQVKAEVVAELPLPAPVRAGDALGRLEIYYNVEGKEHRQAFPLVAANDVALLPPLMRVVARLTRH